MAVVHLFYRFFVLFFCFVFFFVFQESDSDGAQESVEKSNTKKTKYNDSSEKDNIADLEFINNAIKATKTEKKSKKQQ